MFLQRIHSSEASVGHSYNLIDIRTRKILNVETASMNRISVREVGATPFFHANMYLHLPVQQVCNEPHLDMWLRFMLKHHASTPNKPTICSPLHKYFPNPHQQSNAGSDNFSDVVKLLARSGGMAASMTDAVLADITKQKVLIDQIIYSNGKIKSLILFEGTR